MDTDNEISSPTPQQKKEAGDLLNRYNSATVPGSSKRELECIDECPEEEENSPGKSKTKEQANKEQKHGKRKKDIDTGDAEKDKHKTKGRKDKSNQFEVNKDEDGQNDALNTKEGGDEKNMAKGKDEDKGKTGGNDKDKEDSDSKDKGRDKNKNKSKDEDDYSEKKRDKSPKDDSDGKASREDKKHSKKHKDKKGEAVGDDNDSGVKSNDTILSEKSDNKEDKKKKGSKKKKGKDKDVEKGDEESLDRKKDKSEGKVRPATRKDFYGDDDEESIPNDMILKRKYERNSDERYYNRRHRRSGTDDEEGRYTSRGNQGRSYNDYDGRRDDYRTGCEKDFRRQGGGGAGCDGCWDCNDGKRSCERVDRLGECFKGICGKKEFGWYSRDNKQDACKYLTNGTKDMCTETLERKRATCFLCDKRDDDYGRDCQRKYEGRRRMDSYSDRQGGRGAYRDDRRAGYKSEERDWYMEERQESLYGRNERRDREGGHYQRNERPGVRDEDDFERREYSRSGAKRSTRGEGFIDESGEGQKNRTEGRKKVESSMADIESQRSDDSESVQRGSRKTDQSSYNEKSVMRDEILRLRDELVNLQTELDNLKECLKSTLSEKNKCTVAKAVRENLVCNLPDLCSIREKLRECQLLRRTMCGEERCCSSRPTWKKDFEMLMCELNAIRGDLEQLKREKR